MTDRLRLGLLFGGASVEHEVSVVSARGVLAGLDPARFDCVPIGVTGEGEWLWRPLLNPDRPFTTSFAMQRLRGFGLMQRDRSFVSYEDAEARYDQRPSVWIRPDGDWGAGRVELMQYHSPDETNDNVVAYWVPERLPASGLPLTLGYSMLWQSAAQQSPPRQGRVLQSRLGRGLERPQPGELQFHIDYAGGSLDGLSAVSTPQANGSTSPMPGRAHRVRC